MRATSRILGVSINTVYKFLVDIGHAATEYQDAHFRNLKCQRIQCDEVWSFCYAKKKNVPPERQGQLGYGDLWTWIAMDPDSKLVPCWMVGRRDLPTAKIFMNDLASRLSNRIQLATDGYKAYVEAVDDAFGIEIDYGMLVKLYGDDELEDKVKPSDRYKGSKLQPITGEPIHISTSIIERQNLTLRMSNRRFTRRTNAHSKKYENHMHALALHYLYYNFARVHQTLRVSPAMAAGVTDKLWDIGDIVRLLDVWEKRSHERQ